MLDLTFQTDVSIADIATGVTALIALVALIFAILQVREARRQRVAHMTQHVFEMLSDKASRERRRWVYNDLPASATPESIGADDWSKIEDVWSEFARVALYMELNLVDEDAILRMYLFATIATWDRLEPFVDYQAERRGGRGIFMTGFRKMAEKAREHWTREHPGRELPRVSEWIPNYRERPPPNHAA